MQGTDRDEPTCPCGSGKERHGLYDARGIFVAYVCVDCEEKTRAKYRTDIFNDSAYACDEDIEQDYWGG